MLYFETGLDEVESYLGFCDEFEVFFFEHFAEGGKKIVDGL